MVNLTLKDLFHEKARFILVILGLSMSILMVNFGIGFLNSSMEENRRFLEKHPQYDAFVTQENRQTIFQGGEVKDSVYNETKSLDCVREVQKLMIINYGIKVEDEIVGTTMIGYDLSSDIGPWDIIEGKEVNLDKKYTIMVDISVRKFIPSLKVGDKIETDVDKEMEIVGFVENSKFWGNPIAWASFETVQLLEHVGNISTTLAIDLYDDHTIQDLKDGLKKKNVNVISYDDVYDYQNTEVLDNMGSSVGMLVLIGFFVTMVIISATMYSTIMEKIPELVSMKALGAGQGFINRILVGQVVIFITISTILGTLGAYALTPLVNNVSVYGLSVSLIWAFLIYGIALNLGILCAMLSMRKVKKTDPAVIFRA